ncbi:MAG: hypothetical protein LBN23_06505 [Paludibacter sp.]|jgi:hypothetical protein|nr:hypothetical protein [Paludibacter sp.]
MNSLLSPSEIVKRLNVRYYTIYTFVILFTVIGYFLNFSNLHIFDYSSRFAAEYLPVIFIILSALSVIVGFGSFELIKKKLSLQNDEREKVKKYIKVAGSRLYFIGFVLIFGILVFYISRSISTLYCIGIAAVLLILCKPNENKVSNDLKI